MAFIGLTHYRDKTDIAFNPAHIAVVRHAGANGAAEIVTADGLAYQVIEKYDDVMRLLRHPKEV